MDLFEPLLAVALVLGLLWAAIYFLKRHKFAVPAVLGRAARKDADLEVAARLPLSTTHSLCLVRDGERSLLLGLYPNGIVLLGESSLVRHEGSTAS